MAYNRAMSTIRLLGLVGSLRRGSWNRALLTAIGRELPADVALDEYPDLTDLPIFDPDAPSLPEPVTRLQEAIAAADGLLFVTPEYNYSIPGFLKNAIDWSSRAPSPLRGKPAAVASTSIGMSGGMRAQYHLRQILVYTDTPVLAQPEIIIPYARDRFTPAGEITDESTRELLSRFGVAMASWVRRLGRAS
jgi:chromate reductase, NAD(P)H dehydrogenase (quinone)